MSQEAKSPVLILVVLVFFALALVGGAYHLLQKERGKNLSLQTELDEVKNKQKVTEAKLEESKKATSEMEQKLKDTQGQIDTLRRQLEQEKADKEQALTRASQMQSELDKQKALRSDLEQKYSQAQEETARIQSQLNELKNKKIELESRIRDLEAKAAQLEQQQAQAQPAQGVDLGTVVVEGNTAEGAGGSEGAAMPVTEPQPQKKLAGPEGKVLVVNREYNFAVINQGSKDGVSIGDIFKVYRGNKELGEIKIEKIHESMSAGTFLTPQIKDKINEGDRVMPSAK
jgi:predicted RNase H-like nuclease (RuvC/YqgF family)